MPDLDLAHIMDLGLYLFKFLLLSNFIFHISVELKKDEIL